MRWYTTSMNFYEAIRAICDSSFTAPFVGRLEKKRSELVQNKKRTMSGLRLKNRFVVCTPLPLLCKDTALSKDKATIEELSTKLYIDT